MFLQEQLKGSPFLPSKRKENRNRKGMDTGSGLPSRVHASIIAQSIPFFQKNRSTYFDFKSGKPI